MFKTLVGLRSMATEWVKDYDSFREQFTASVTKDDVGTVLFWAAKLRNKSARKDIAQWLIKSIDNNALEETPVSDEEGLSTTLDHALNMLIPRVKNLTLPLNDDEIANLAAWAELVDRMRDPYPCG